jgi:hypothetical protein
MVQVAKAWTDSAYAKWLKEDATAAIKRLGFTGRQREHMVALFNTPKTHNWWSAPCAHVTRGRCLACRLSGINPCLIVHAPSLIPAVF